MFSKVCLIVRKFHGFAVGQDREIIIRLKIVFRPTGARNKLNYQYTANSIKCPCNFLAEKYYFLSVFPSKYA